MLTESADYMDLLSEHIYDKELDSLQAHILQIKKSIKRVADAHRGYLEKIDGLKEKLTAPRPDLRATLSSIS